MNKKKTTFVVLLIVLIVIIVVVYPVRLYYLNQIGNIFTETIFNKNSQTDD